MSFKYGHIQPVNESGNVEPDKRQPIREARDTDQYWEWLSGSFYNNQPAFDNTSFSTMVIACSGLIEVAESIDALIAIRDKVELALRQKDTALWKTIAREPVIWANLGKKLQSSSIFKEAVKHVVGKWRTLTQQGEIEDLQEDVE